MYTLLITIAAGVLHFTPVGPNVVVSADPAGVAAPSDAALARIHAHAVSVAEHVKSLLPELTDDIHLRVRVVDNDLDPVGGVAGWAAKPGEVQLLVSNTYPGGIDAAITDGLATVLYHEFHHLWRGWTIEGNRFGPGIPTAMVNEGLAAVFADEFSGVAWERFDYPENVRDWLQEILGLPLDADYNAWMNDHPDGRIAVGYRTGRFVVHEAMTRSGRGIIELSELGAEEILALVRE